MLSSSLSRLVISVSSLADAQAFYTGRLGLPLVRRSGGMATLVAGEVEVLLHERPSRPSDASVCPCLSVEGLDDVVGAIQSAGGVVVDEPASQPWGEYMAVVRDPDGHLVCLVDRQHGAGLTGEGDCSVGS